MKKVISMLLILTTLMSCCVMFFACGDDETSTGILNEQGRIPKESSTILDISTSELESADVKEGEPAAAKWTVGKNANNRSLKLDLSVTDLSKYKEITFWMNNTSNTAFTFRFYFITEDGTEYMAASDLDYPYIDKGNASMHAWTYLDYAEPVQYITAYPGWYQYTFPFSEVDVLTGGKLNPNKDNGYKQWTYDEKTGKSEVKFDKSKIVAIKIDASVAQNITSDIGMEIGSIVANNNKYGTIKGFGISKLSNAVAFYKHSEAYMYNQHRMHLTYNEMDALEATGESVYVPIEILAKHRGATNIIANKDLVTFKYNGVDYEFKAGDTYTYVADERTSATGLTLKGEASSIGDYLTVPMEVARDALGYKLFYDVSGLVIFSDRGYPDATKENDTNYWKNNWEKVSYVSPQSDLYYTGNTDDLHRGNQLRYIAQISKVICYDYITGQEMLEDMDNIHGKNSHGNILVSNAQIEKLKGYLETDSVYASWFAAYSKHYEKGSPKWTAKMPEFFLSDGTRMDCENAELIEDFAFMYRMTGEEDYAEQVVKIMKALLRFKDWVSGAKSWHPEHFLDCAKPMLYYAIGYDWCYDYIAKDEELKAQLEEGAWEYAYGAAMGHGELFDWWSDPNNIKEYKEKAAESTTDDIKPAPWKNCKFPYSVNPFNYNWSNPVPCRYDVYSYAGNWNAVCNGGMTQIAFAFANVDSKFRAASEYLLSYTVNDTTFAMFDCYAPDGAHPEGPGYWWFGTKDQVPFFETILNCTGSYHGLHQMPGYEDSLYYVLGLSAPNGSAWNYHDCSEGTELPSNGFFALAKQCNLPEIAQFRYKLITSGQVNLSIMDLQYYDPAICHENPNIELALDYVSYKIGMTTFRSSWDETALYAGLHGGDNAAGHGQLDIGAFILQYGDTRFFVDLGSDNYVCPGYFSNPARWWLYRNRIEGHNSLVINPEYVDRNLNKWADDYVTGAGQYSDVWACDMAQRSLEGFNMDQAYSAVSKVLKYRTSDKAAYSVVDMGCAYGWYNNRQANKANANNMIAPEGKRGLLLTDNRSTVVIQDEFDLSVFNQRMKIGTGTTAISDVPFYDKHTIIWNGHIAEGGVIKITDDCQTAFITYNGMTLQCDIVVPKDYKYTWKFESRSADYLRETGITSTPGEYPRDGKQKLVAITELPANNDLSQELRIAVVCRLVSAGPHTYTWTDIDNWDQFLG